MIRELWACAAAVFVLEPDDVLEDGGMTPPVAPALIGAALMHLGLLAAWTAHTGPLCDAAHRAAAADARNGAIAFFFDGDVAAAARAARLDMAVVLVVVCGLASLVSNARERTVRVRPDGWRARAHTHAAAFVASALALAEVRPPRTSVCARARACLVCAHRHPVRGCQKHT